MNDLLIPGSLALAVFVLSYLRSGRYGLTVIAIGAGYLLAQLWSDTLASYTIVGLPFTPGRDVIFSCLVLLPGVLTLLFGSQQKSLLPRIVAALGVAVFALALLVPVLMPEPSNQQFIVVFSENRDVVISCLLVLGLIDVLFSRPPKAPKRHKD